MGSGIRFRDPQENAKSASRSCGDLMIPGREFNPAATSSHVPSHAARRLLLAAAAAAGYDVQSWDIPGAYPRAPSDPAFRQAWLLADTDDFLVLAPTHCTLNTLRQLFHAHWQVTVQRIDTSTLSIQHAGIIITRTDVGGLRITNPRLVSQLLRDKDAAECRPRTIPWPSSTDLSSLRPDERATNATTYRSIVGGVRFLADTTIHPYLTSSGT
eukprot:IDg20559t1